MGRKTHEQFMEDFNKKNEHAKDIEILGTYVTSKTKIKCRCKVCGKEWEVTPNSLLGQKSGCPICGAKRIAEKQTKTHKQFIQEFKQNNKHYNNIELLGTYQGTKTKILCKCKIDGHIWETTPNVLLRGHGCPICSYKKISMSLVKTHKQFMQKLQEVNLDIQILGTYVNTRTKIKCKCKIDGCEWEARPNDLLRGHGCPECMKITHDKFIQRFNKLNPYANDIEVLGTYKGALNKIKCRCKIDGCEWEALSSNLLRGTGCPKCAEKRIAQKQTKTHEQFITELQEINPDILVLETYKGVFNPIKVKCKIDGYIWEARPSNLLNGVGCPKCKITKGEKRVAQYLDNLNIEYIYNKKYFKDLVGTGGGLLRPDFIIPTLKIWIEYDGEQHFEPVDFTSKGEQWAKKLFKQVQQNDQIKNQYAKDNNWTLIRIPYWDIDNIEQILDAVLKQEQAI